MNFMGVLRTGHSVREARASYQRDESAAVAYYSNMSSTRFAAVRLEEEAEEAPELAQV